MGISTLEIGELSVDIQKGESKFLLIMKGAIRASFGDVSYVLRNGDVVALLNTYGSESPIEYEIIEKTNAVDYSFCNGHIRDFLLKNKDIRKYLVNSLFKQLNEISGRYKLLKNEYSVLRDYLMGSFEEYEELCQELELTPLELENYEEVMGFDFIEILPDWMTGYYEALEATVKDISFGDESVDYLSGVASKAVKDILQMIVACEEIGHVRMNVVELLMNDNGSDLYEMYIFLLHKALKKTGSDSFITGKLYRTLEDILSQCSMQRTDSADLIDMRRKELQETLATPQETVEEITREESVQNDIVSELKNSAKTIVEYSGVDQGLAKAFLENVNAYCKLSNKNGSEDVVRTLRLKLTRAFNEIYAKAFLRSVSESSVPTVIMMFFNFGYVDEKLIGMDNAIYLYKLCKAGYSAPDKGIFSMYEWLEDIYFSKKDPGRSEFDVDYAEYLHEKQRNREISKEEEQSLFGDSEARVRYELDNVFPVVNKTTTGRITTFCPLLSEHNVMKSFESMKVDADRIIRIVNSIRAVDHGAFFRETVFTDPDNGVSKEFVDVEVLPDFILTPNIGNRGIMWQEIEGKRRTTPARMFVSVFQQEDFEQQVRRLTGQFRWEMCKRVQGARWNDVTERSLTSEYFDYIQYYRKNNDLTPEAKEKIKNDLLRSKNSFREMFIRDYVVWIQYESEGSPRLNKIVRAMFCTYIPFSKPIRDKLKANPMYRELIEKYELKQKSKTHRLENLMKKISNTGKEIPVMIRKQFEYLSS